MELLRTTLLGSTLVVAGCATDHRDGTFLGETTQAIVSGRASLPGEADAVVAIAFSANGRRELDCTGILIAPNLVLTARICVADPSGGGTFTDLAPGSFSIFIGANANQQIVATGAAAATGRQIFVAGNTGTVAVVLLDRAVAGTPATLRLDAVPTLGETITVAGFGYDTAGSLPSRQERANVPVVTVGPDATSSLLAGEFATGEALCWFDEGGPALSASRAVIGVATFVDSPRSFDTNAPSASCAGARGIFSSLASVKDVLDRAFAAAGATPKVEGARPASSSDAGSDDELAADESESEKETVRRGDDPAALRELASTGCAVTYTSDAPTSRWPWLGLVVALVRRARRRGPLDVSPTERGSDGSGAVCAPVVGSLRASRAST